MLVLFLGMVDLGWMRERRDDRMVKVEEREIEKERNGVREE